MANGLGTYYEFREQLADALVKETVGPWTEDEVLDDAPLTAYASGVLYPRDSGRVDASLDVDVPEEDEESSATDIPVALANVRYPSSMGMTFAVDADAGLIRVHVRAARYVEIIETATREKGEGADTEPPGGSVVHRWRREPLTFPPMDVDTGTAIDGQRRNLGPGLDLFVRVRPRRGSAVPVTVALVNTYTVPRGEYRDAHSFFQPEIRATAAGETEAVFVERPPLMSSADDETLGYRLLYRHAREFAVGHGCAPTWTISSADPSRVREIVTTFAPTHELRVAQSNPNIPQEACGLRFLVDAPKEQVLAGLEALGKDYVAWIDERKREADTLPSHLRPAADAHLSVCGETSARMRRGVDRLRRDPTAWRAFRLMNRAMLEQRARTTWLHDGKQTPVPAASDLHRWRPFQLAFILLCLDGLVDPTSGDRDIADLLWFPTGGGKTEAYLGLIAFAIFLRRLRYGKEGGGVTALMRYTLRLLTLQQFERASLMICCCEEIRRSEPSLGEEPISIGLWVGQAATPNSLDDARRGLDALRSGRQPPNGNPVQLRSCPWCGASLAPQHYGIGGSPRRLEIRCPGDGCAFRTGLPAYVVDEDIYTTRPTLIIATVDKFAGLPWREEAAQLFNLPDGPRAGQRPPELIVQDELHLISGPLGTLTGLYETAIDAVCSREGIRPKIVASTATIRRAGAQSIGLFDRQVRQFPPPGLDARDSYFAVEAPPESSPTRLYVGLMAPGHSHTTLLVRSYALLLQKVYELQAPPEVKDPYWTLVGYFNSLRVLGGARMQVQDDVNDRVALVAGRNAADRRPLEEKIELTSRESSADIPGHLERMAVSHPDPEALDVILATNMISVGMDVDRLGLMVVMGQPQTTSEYIQSTSRVGRRYPGLIVTLLNAARTRDRSHYESFEAFHSALYRQVESTSVTPFSARSRDRGLHAVLIALARLLIPELRPNLAAALVPRYLPEVRRLRDLVLDRVRSTSPAESEAAAKQLDAFIARWEGLAGGGNGLVYRAFAKATEPALMVPAQNVLENGVQFADYGGPFPTLWSLRDVDLEAGLYLVDEKGD